MNYDKFRVRKICIVYICSYNWYKLFFYINKLYTYYIKVFILTLYIRVQGCYSINWVKLWGSVW